ncbi:MAG TPA: colicin V production protein [Bacteroidales bacterium]|nr:MAG: hypothetical protein A2W98_15100 [Bacteroidetes bacterium GWF2_33_38]OFY91180.1 MAG: hypothetical protein A2236_00685 [Bacteroidetes bacterium RIFOXYA2_FULL_33_7]HBF88804.1 colicin V production protein [Bacteroidales bacterium]
MHYIDILIIIPLLWGAYKGFTKGLITEIASLLSLILGIYGAIKLSNYTSSFLIKTFDFTSEYLPVISFAITFIIIVILVHLISKLIDSMIKTASLGVVNRILGAVFGTAKFLLILGVVIILLNRFDPKSKVISEEIKKESLLYKPISDMVLTIYPSIAELDFNKMKEDVISTPEKSKE